MFLFPFEKRTKKEKNKIEQKYHLLFMYILLLIFFLSTHPLSFLSFLSQTILKLKDYQQKYKKQMQFYAHEHIKYEQ